MKRVLYFHGFASSPHGRKVDRLREALEPEGYEIVAPDLNVPSFRWLDFDSMVELGIRSAEDTVPAVFVGSSLGSLVALAVAEATPTVPLVLIAPAFAIGERWLNLLPDGDPINVFHYGLDAETEIHRRFFEQMARVSIDESPPCAPVTVLMGRADESVPFDLVSGRWNEWQASGMLATGSDFVEITDGDHRLIASSERIADAIRSAALRSRSSERGRTRQSASGQA